MKHDDWTIASLKKTLRSKVLFSSVSSAEVQFKYHHHFERKWMYPVGYRTVLEVDIIPDTHYCLQTWVSNWWFFTTSTWGFAPGSTCQNRFIFCWFQAPFGWPQDSSISVIAKPPGVQHQKKVEEKKLGDSSLGGNGRVYLGVSNTRGTPKWMVYNGKPY